MTATFEGLVARCEASVTLTVNDYRDAYQTKAQYFDQKKFFGDDDVPAGDELARLLAADHLYELQFYPDTPIGSYTILGTSLDEVVAKAHTILDNKDTA